MVCLELHFDRLVVGNKMTAIGPQVPFSDELHGEKYRLENENFREGVNRQAYFLKDDDDHFRQLKDIWGGMRHQAAGRVQAGSGAPKAVTLLNCFVSGTIADSFVDDPGSIMQRASEAASTMRMGGGIGYDFSTLRPKGDLIRGVMAQTDGPMAFLPIYDAICRATSSAGNRRGAQMGVLRIDHPDIVSFVHAKQDLTTLTGFNLSVAVTDEFMECLAAKKPFALRWGGRTYQEVDPQDLFEMIMRSTWDWGDPGVLFIDRMNEMNNLYYAETIAATNPCGEQPLPPHGACLLGSFMLPKYIVKADLLGLEYEFDWDLFKADIPPIIRAMDNVVDRSKYPLEKQKEEALAKRRIGMGISGLANAAEALGFPYASEGFMDFQLKILDTLRTEAYLASADLAEEKGSFPKFDADLYLAGKFVKTLPDHVRHAIKHKGLRNSHLTSIAPTGTISLCADNMSSGIEPVFSYGGKRLVNMKAGQKLVELTDYGYREFGVRGRLANEVSAQEHVQVLAAAQALVDSSVSKTCNVDGSMEWDEFKNIYQSAFEFGCKGVTTFNKDGKKMGILAGDVTNHVSKEAPEAACWIDPQSGVRECSD
jgi:ribonucleoside-diphosphate reductase alpha chain